MIKKGLKVGDTFEDGGLIYKIDSIHELGYYVSSLVGKAGEGAKAEKKEDAVGDISLGEPKKTRRKSTKAE